MNTHDPWELAIVGVMTSNDAAGAHLLLAAKAAFPEHCSRTAAVKASR